jgi:hypothetical protein
MGAWCDGGLSDRKPVGQRGLNRGTETEWQRHERDLSTTLFESILDEDAVEARLISKRHCSFDFVSFAMRICSSARVRKDSRNPKPRSNIFGARMTRIGRIIADQSGGTSQ